MAGMIARIIVAARPALAEFGSRRRAGMEFTRTPREIDRKELPEGIEGLRAVLALATDPHLVVSIGDEDGDVRLITEDEIAELRAGLDKLELAEIDRVDPANPPSVLAEFQMPPDVLPPGALMVADPETEPEPKSDAEPDTAREDSPPAGEETASPAAEAKPRGAAKKVGAKS